MTCQDCVYAEQPTTTMRCRNHGIYMATNAVVCNEFKYRTQTNADCIRAKSNEELADYACSIGICTPNSSGKTCFEMQNCKICWLDWLMKEADAK